MEGRLGYVSLPGVQGAEQSYEEYVRRGRKTVTEADRPPACGWVVDLRRNRGGNMWPMLAVVARIRGDGKVGGFVDAEGRTSVWTIEDGSPRIDGRPAGWRGGEPVSNGDAPVAVLTSRATASSGEAVAVAFRGRPDTRSFGESTYGVPTGNQSHRLSDGAALLLTETKDVDRTGRAYDAPIDHRLQGGHNGSLTCGQRRLRPLAGLPACHHRAERQRRDQQSEHLGPQAAVALRRQAAGGESGDDAQRE
ncbi:S41 family peptidase [Streptomyces massasporeus]|uniref:S41 family peptidase n=1 Tax=Streptomyces massasporeus TaxID=67324 RepID=A0ABW6LDF0_9ACTN